MVILLILTHTTTLLKLLDLAAKRHGSKQLSGIHKSRIFDKWHGRGRQRTTPCWWSQADPLTSASVCLLCCSVDAYALHAVVYVALYVYMCAPGKYTMLPCIIPQPCTLMHCSHSRVATQSATTQ